MLSFLFPGSLLTARIAGAAVTAFLVTILFGPTAIRWLKARFRERIASDSAQLNELHSAKQDTPTMGGLFVTSAVLLSVLVWGDLQNSYVQICLFVMLTLTALGAADDWIKQRTTRKGLTARQKLLGQLVIGCVAGAWLMWAQEDANRATAIVLPISGAVIALGPLFVIWAAIVLTATTNSVNLTDGLDGLATGCALTTASAYALLTYLAGHAVLADYLSVAAVPTSGDVSVVMGALVGSLLGFLWFNCFPAKVFLGDSGSLPIGGLIATAALVCHQELLLPVIGGVFVIETLSVIVQVFWFRRTGNRVLKCSPLHNHFVFRGDHETNIVVRFWIVSVVLAILGLASLKLPSLG